MTREELFEVAESKHDIKISGAIEEGFKIFKKNIGGFVGIAAINLLISYALGLIPFAGQIISYFVQALISAGIILVCKKIRNGEEPQFNDFFEVFKDPGQFLLLLLIQIMVVAMSAIPLLGMIGMKYYTLFTNGSIPSSKEILSMFPLLLLLTLPIIFVAICYTFSMHVFLFINKDFWTAMEASRKVVMKNFFPIFGLFILLGLLTLVVVLFTCGLGIFVMPSILAASVYVVFEDIFKPSVNTFDTKIDSFGSVHKDLNTEADEKNF